MKSLVISDIHDNIRNLESVLTIGATANCDSVICCGDLCSPFVIDVLHKNCALPIHIIFGNNDGDRINISLKISHINTLRKTNNKIQLHGDYLIAEKNHNFEGVPNNISFAVYHYPEMSKVLAQSGLFDFVFCGHKHQSSLESINNSMLANPGSVMGYLPGPVGEFIAPTCLIVNWETKELELISF